MEQKNNTDIINKKLEQVKKILKNLAEEYGFDFMLNFVSNDIGCGLVYNREIENSSIEHFLCHANDLYNLSIYQTNLLHDGFLLAVCLDDKHKPDTLQGKWLQREKTYIIENIYPKKDKGCVYSLIDIEDYEKINCLCDMDRFKLLSLTSKLN